ncbi:hypothetical protein J4411_01920 [Candidatus Pacearchaeota archaeon]|nr:hypothetical protein [Candidatus Pacearchaeota archaeon]
MEKETKEAFDILLSNIEEKKNFLKENFSPSYKKSPIEISVYETADLAGLHLFSDYNEEFRLSKRQGYLIREYFQMTQIEDAINELYDFYPSIFSGEPIFKISHEHLLGSHVPRYNQDEIEK